MLTHKMRNKSMRTYCIEKDSNNRANHSRSTIIFDNNNAVRDANAIKEESIKCTSHFWLLQLISISCVFITFALLIIALIYLNIKLRM